MSLEKIRIIENKYAVESILSNGHQVWPLIRFSLWAYFRSDVEPIHPGSLGFRKMLKLIAQFFYGFPNYLRKHEYLAFSDSSERKSINGKWVDKSVDYILGILPNAHLIELPLPYHYSKSSVATASISSKLPLYGFEWIYAKFFLRKLHIENERIIHQILHELNISFDYRNVLRRNLAQHKIGRLLQAIYKPKGVIIQCSYTNIGYTKAFKDSSVPVIEVQHGLITSVHEAYNVFKKLDRSYYPDYFLSYGSREIEIFSHGNFIYPVDNVIPVGHFYLDLINSSRKTKQEIIPEVEQFDFGVSITGQMLPGVEERLVEFVKAVAEAMPHICFFYIPRNAQSYIFNIGTGPKNLINAFGRDTYEVIRLTSYHSTIFSTCAIEALVLGTPNVLIDIDNLAKTHLYEFLSESESTVFVTSIEEYIERLNTFVPLPKDKIIEQSSYLILSGYRENVKKVIETVLK